MLVCQGSAAKNSACTLSYHRMDMCVWQEWNCGLLGILGCIWKMQFFFILNLNQVYSIKITVQLLIKGRKKTPTKPTKTN